MERVEAGLTSTQTLFFYLVEFFKLEAVNLDGSGLYDQITYIENTKGNWKIGFTTVPKQNLLLAICALFETRLANDGLEEIIFNYGTSKATAVKEIAGSVGTGDGVNRLFAAHRRMTPGVRF